MNEADTNLLLELHDIHAAPPPSFWPPAAGWWLLTLLLLLLIFLATRWLKRYYQRWRRRQRVLRHLAELYQACQHDHDIRTFAAESSILLRRVVLTLFPRQQVAGLSDEDWLRFLDNTGGDGQFQQGAGQQLTVAPYTANPTVDAEALYILIRGWIQRNL